MTDLDRQAVNERIATAMGYRPSDNPAWWYAPVTACFVPRPDYFTDPVAADELMRWIEGKRKQGWSVQIAVDSYGWSVCVDHAIGHYVRHSEDDWKHALALAADKAIEEAERGETKGQTC
ncbi:hypothetical protein LCGC14_2264980 [marine sediment metagenome]|uniref:Phage ABA sandwich domain-containing protein n=1 Tax=marine sediment metagenome TaxID=412755 RepID=A0A0F9FTL7_9ZZZZ